MRSWNLLEIATPDGSRSPVVLHSDKARAVLIELAPGQELREHEVKEQAFVTVVDGTVRVEAGGDTTEAGVGSLFVFEPEERHSIASANEQSARILLLLAPWPGEGHYRGEEREVAS